MKVFLFLLTTALSMGIHAAPPITSNTLKSISAEGKKNVEQTDFLVVEKYMHPDSKVVVDFDPAPNVGEKEMAYNDYMALTRTGFANMKDINVDVEILSIKINKAKNQGTIKEKISATMTMMGLRMRDVSVNKTTYGYIDGEIKVLSMHNTAISNEVLP